MSRNLDGVAEEGIIWDFSGIETYRLAAFDYDDIHYSIRGGWVWNLWGRACVVVHFKNGVVLWIGTDDAENLTKLLSSRIVENQT